MFVTDLFQDSSVQVLEGLHNLTNYIKGDLTSSLSEVRLRDFMFSLANLYVGGLMIEHSRETKSDSDASVTHQWVTRRDLVPFVTNYPYFVTDKKLMQEVIFEGYNSKDTFASSS